MKKILSSTETTSLFQNIYINYIAFKKIVAAFRGMHVSPAKHSYGSDTQTDGRTDRQTTDKVIPLCCYASQATQKTFLRCKGVYMVYIIKRPLLLANLENFPDTNNNGRF